MELTGKEKFSYGLAAVGKDIVYMLSASYILYYYQDILGVNAIAMGAILMAARVFDAFNDPIMGVLVAKTKTKWGRFRPWLLIGTILNAVILFILFSAPPALNGSGLVAYAAITYILWGLTYTMMDIPYWSMIPAFTKGGKQREGLTTLARSCAGIGSAFITIVTMLCVPVLGRIGQPHLGEIVDEYRQRIAQNLTVSAELQETYHAAETAIERNGFRWFALLAALTFIAFITICCINIKEKSTVDVKAPTVKEMMKALLQNDQAVAVVVAIVLINCSFYITTNLTIYFFKYDFGGVGWNRSYTLFNTFGGIIQILSMLLLFPTLRKTFSVMKVFVISVLMEVGGYLGLLLVMLNGSGNLFLLLIPAFFIFAAFGMLTVLTTVFLANTVDYGEYKNNRRDESVIFSMQTFVVKLASGVAVLITSICLQAFHISKNTEVQVRSTELLHQANENLMGLRLTMTLVPIVGLLLGFWYFQKRYVLTEEKLHEIEQALHRR